MVEILTPPPAAALPARPPLGASDVPAALDGDLCGLPQWGRVLFLLLTCFLLLRNDSFYRLLLASRAPRQGGSALGGAERGAQPFAGPPFCPGSTTTLCDSSGEIIVSVPLWALSALPAPKEFEVLPDPVDWPWSYGAGSQYGECGYAARELFYGLQGGVIVESGALDGMLFSTSLGFVKGYQWRAVHVEANPDNYAQLVNNRRDAININAGLCSADTSLHYLSDNIVKEYGIGRYYKDLDANGVTPVSGFWEFMSPTLRERWWGGVTESDVARLPATPCRALSHLLQLFGITHVNLWILDVEGAESSVLAGFDFDAVRVDVVGIELDGTNLEKDEASRAVLRRNGFILHRRGHPYTASGPSELGMDNEWWVNTEHFNLSYEAMLRASRGDLAWAPTKEHYKDSTQCCYARDP